MHLGASHRFIFHYMNSYITSIERQIQESIKIEFTDCDNIINGNGEFMVNIVSYPHFEAQDDKYNSKINHRSLQTDGETARERVDIDEQDSDSCEFFSQFSQRKRKKRQRVRCLKVQRMRDLTVQHQMKESNRL